MYDDKIDIKNIWTALSTEVNARLSSRTTIHIAHIQIILAVAAAFISIKGAKYIYSVSDIQARRLDDFSFCLSAIIPLISLYFVLLFQQVDMQIGLLYRYLRRIQDDSIKITESFRFYGGEQESMATPRRRSHIAIMLLCGTSPILLFLNYIVVLVEEGRKNFPVHEIGLWGALAVLFVTIVSIANIRLLRKTQKFRESLYLEK